MARTSDIQPNMIDRLFLMIDALQGPSALTLYTVSCHGTLQPDVLRQALVGLLAEQPLLRTRARRTAWRVSRWVVDVQAVDSVLTIGAGGPGVGQAAPEELAFMRRRLDLETEPPIRLLLRETPTGARLVLGLHHSVADGIGGYFVLDRLAAHYTAQLAGLPVEPPPLAPPRDYAQYVRATKPGLGELKGFGGVLREELVGLGPYATFGDLPQPARGEFTWTERVLPPALVGQLRTLARARGGTLTDLLLAATAEAGLATWPSPDGYPLRVMVPVSLRDGPAVDMSNRVSEVPVELAASACLAFDTAFDAARQVTPRVRDRSGVIARICQYAVVSRLPPGVVRGILSRAHGRGENHSMTYVFSNPGILDPQPRDFGDARVVSVAGSPPVYFPPGLAIFATTARESLTLTIAWLDPVLAQPRVDAFCAALEARLTGLAAAA